MKTPNALVSVIIPAFNAEKFIEDAVVSLLNQTYPNVEIIIINDGSSDNTDGICKSLCSGSDKIRCFSQSNSGVSNTRNRGMELAAGEYICFMDSDDLLPSYAIELLVNEIERSGADAVYGNIAYKYGNKIIERPPRIDDGIYTYADLQDRLMDDGTMTGFLFGSVCGCIYRKSSVEKAQLRFNTNVARNEDGFFNFIFVKNAERVSVVTHPYTYIYRQWKPVSKKALTRDVRLEKAADAIMEYLQQNGETELFRKQLARRSVSVMFWNALLIKDHKAKFGEAIKYLKQLFSDREASEGLRCMNYAEMNKYKKMLCFLMKHRMCLSFYVIIKYFYPVLERIIKR